MANENDEWTIQEYLEKLKTSLVSLMDSIDAWLACIERIAKFLKSDIPMDKYRAFIQGIKKGIQEVYDTVVSYQEQFTEALGETLLGKLMELENLWGDFVIQTDYMGKSIKNVGEGLIPENTNLSVPKSWRDYKKLFGKESSTF